MKLKKKYHTLDTKSRLYNMEKPILGLTGGIATGKSSVSELLKKKGLLILCADSLVKQAYQIASVINAVTNLCPQAIDKGALNFKILREQVFKSPELKTEIEKIIYARLPSLFISEANKQQQDFIIYDVPLLFERKLEQKVDQKICVYCNEIEQRKRLIRRDNNDEQLVDKMLKSQFPIEEKRKLADYVLDNSFDLANLEKEVDLMFTHYFEI